MYAIKPGGSVYFLGCSVTAYASAIGMRWRESNTTLVEQKRDPSYEKSRRRRCVVTEQTVKLLVDLGCTERLIRGALRPTHGWRFLTPQLEVLRESTVFPGCAMGEVTYHCTEGELLRLLRSEYLRFGGSLLWGTKGMGAMESNDGSGTWTLRKEYGLGTGAEAIISTTQGTRITDMLMADDPGRMAVMFDVKCGLSEVPPEEKDMLFGSKCDVAMVIGRGLAIHCWLTSRSQCSWRLIRKPTAKAEEKEEPLEVHRAVNSLLLNCIESTSSMCILPGTTPAIKDSAASLKVSILGDALLPVDPFEWRGDRCRIAIEESSALCRALYGKKYHRGDVPFILRGLEQDCLSRRAETLRRDLQDAEHFLAVNPLLDSEPAEPAPRRISSHITSS